MCPAGSGFVPHGFLSLFRDWSAERTYFSSERSQNKRSRTSSRAKPLRRMQRSDLFERRRKLMDTWHAFCAASPIVEASAWSRCESKPGLPDASHLLSYPLIQCALLNWIRTKW